jgi:hypothetical protein
MQILQSVLRGGFNFKGFALASPPSLELNRTWFQLQKFDV